MNLSINLYKLAIAVTLITAVVFCTYKACNHPQPVATSSANGKVIPIQPPKQYKSPEGTVYTEVKVVRAANDAQLHSYYKALLAQMQAKLNIKEKQITDLIAAGVTTEGHLIVKTNSSKNNTDTSADSSISTIEQIHYFSFKDKFINLAGRLESDTVNITYKTTDSVYFITHWKRKNFLSKKELYLKGFAQNPQTNIKGLQQLKINIPPPKKWAIGINVGYYFTGQKFVPGIGFGLTKTLIRF